MRIKEHLEKLINDGVYQNGDKLPSETALADELSVSRATLREALRVLEKEGKITKHQGIGTFITEPAPKFQRGIEELFSVTEAIKKAGHVPGTNGLNVEKILPDAKLKSIMDIDEEQPLIKLTRIRTADEEPVVYCEDYLDASFLKLKIDEDFSDSLFKLLEQKHNLKIKYAMTEIIPVIANQQLEDALEVEIGTPVLLLNQSHYNHEDKLFLFSRNYYRNDQFQFKVLRTR